MIYISDTLRITKLDDNCLQLEAYKPVTSKKHGTTTMQWKWLGYYGDVKTALMGALKKQLFDCADEEIEVKNLIERIEQAENNILKAIANSHNKT